VKLCAAWWLKGNWPLLTSDGLSGGAVNEQNGHLVTMVMMDMNDQELVLFPIAALAVFNMADEACIPVIIFQCFHQVRPSFGLQRLKLVWKEKWEVGHISI
jgi:hypothetical protein